MSVLFLLGVFCVYGITNMVDTCTPPAPPRDSRMMDNMLREMCGKSKKECRKILRKYR